MAARGAARPPGRPLRPVRRGSGASDRDDQQARCLLRLRVRPLGRGGHLPWDHLGHPGYGPLADHHPGCRGPRFGRHGQLHTRQVGGARLHDGDGHGRRWSGPPGNPGRDPHAGPDRSRTVARLPRGYGPARRDGLPPLRPRPRGRARPDRDSRHDHHHSAHPPRARPGSGGLTERHDRPRAPPISRPHPSADHTHPGPSRKQERAVSNSDGKNGSDGTHAGTWAGSKRRDGKIRVAIVGVGNCASSLVQGRYYYENAKAGDFVPGLMHVELGGYHVKDIEFVAAFDIDKNKVGKDVSEAIYQKPNNTFVFQQVPHMGVEVERGMTHDGLGKYLSQIIEKAPGPTADIVGILKEREVDVMVSYLPVGSEEATKWYVEQALKAGVAFVNAIPVFIGREPYWQRRFAEAGLPVIGDDIKSQVGATISHRVLTRLFMDRGVRLDRTYQLNFGGNTDFLNMLERERLESKKISKTNAVTSMLDYEMDPDDVHVGPSDHVPWLLDRKWCYIRMEGTTFGDVPLNAELKLEVWDSPNSAGVITDAIRCLKLGLDRGLTGTLVAPSSYFMKSPPQQIHDDIAFNRVEAFIRGEDNETLVGTEAPQKRSLRKMAGSKAKVAAAAAK
ncbi:MAG: hypothetical protein HYX54_01910 [Chloroflexi bacterium]|nr:hypothetical protein [Chloroflexota bacterium]